MEYNRLKNFLIFIIVFYFIAGLLTEVFMEGRQKDLPPFFSWFLFDNTPNEKYTNKYGLQLTKVDGKILNTPILYDKAEGIIEEPESPKARELIRYFGLSLESGKTQNALQFRRDLENIYLPPDTQYSIVRVYYNPITYFKNGKIEKIVEIASFSTN